MICEGSEATHPLLTNDHILCVLGMEELPGTLKALYMDFLDLAIDREFLQARAHGVRYVWVCKECHKLERIWTTT